MSFADLGLPNSLIRALAERGIDAPFAIQSVAIPDALAGHDVLGRASTGSGKTLAFGLPVLARLADRTAQPHKPLALILVPTRELAMQVADALDPLAWRAFRLRVRTAVGGVRYERQINSLRRGTEILVATPGRLTDLCERGACDLSEVEIAVLDEADQMCDMGFQDDVMAILDRTPGDGQRLLFSATLDGDVDELVKGYMKDPVTHSIAPPVATVDTMDHHVLLIPPRQKFNVVAEIANRPGRTILFVRTQMAVDRVTEQLLSAGVPAVGLHGGKPQGQRTRTLAQFKEGLVNVLVATDVAARGIHVDNVSLVVHVDPPRDPKDYLHRAGRTARAGESGRVVTLGLPKQRKTISRLMDKAGVTPTESRVRPGDNRLVEITGASTPSYEPTTVPEPRMEQSRGGHRSRGGYGRYSGHGGYRGRSDGSSHSTFRERNENTFRRERREHNFRNRDTNDFPTRDQERSHDSFRPEYRDRKDSGEYRERREYREYRDRRDSSEHRGYRQHTSRGSYRGGSFRDHRDGDHRDSSRHGGHGHGHGHPGGEHRGQRDGGEHRGQRDGGYRSPSGPRSSHRGGEHRGHHRGEHPSHRGGGYRSEAPRRGRWQERPSRH